MAKKKNEVKELQIERPPRIKLSADEVRKRMRELPKRKEKIIAAVRKGKNRSVSA